VSADNSSERSGKPKVRDSLIFRQLDEEWVVYDAEGERLHVLNSTAALVWLHCTGEYSMGEITDAVAESVEQPVQRERLEDDVQRTIDEFEKKGLIE